MFSFFKKNFKAIPIDTDYNYFLFSTIPIAYDSLLFPPRAHRGDIVASARDVFASRLAVCLAVSRQKIPSITGVSLLFLIF